MMVITMIKWMHIYLSGKSRMLISIFACFPSAGGLLVVATGGYHCDDDDDDENDAADDDEHVWNIEEPEDHSV